MPSFWSTCIVYSEVPGAVFSRQGSAFVRSSAMIASEVPAKERGRFIRKPHDLVRGLAIEHEVQLCLRPTVVPVRERLQLVPAQAALRRCSAPHRDADAGRL